VKDADRLCRDPAMRWVVGDRAIEGTAASASLSWTLKMRQLAKVELCP
jgi:hypothetical protein